MEEGAFASFIDFMSEAGTHYNQSVKSFLSKNFSTWSLSALPLTVEFFLSALLSLRVQLTCAYSTGMNSSILAICHLCGLCTYSISCTTAPPITSLPPSSGRHSAFKLWFSPFLQHQIKQDILYILIHFSSLQYMGISPYEAPATYTLLSYTECAEGVWYVS